MSSDPSIRGPFKPTKKMRERMENDSSDSDEPVTKVGVPSRPSYEMKSRQPGLESITGVPLPELPEVEAEWGLEPTRTRHIPWGWFLLLGMAISGVVAWSISRVMQAESELDLLRGQAALFLDSDVQSELDARELIYRIEMAVQEFGASANLEERLRVSRHPERVRPLMEDHYARHPFETLGELEIVGMYPLTFGRFGGFWMIRVELDDGTRKNMIIEAQDVGDALVDWETFVCYQPMAWDDFARERPFGTGMDFRVYVEETPFRSHEFVDEGMWDAYKLTALDSEEVLYGYVRTASPTAELLRRWFAVRPDSRAMMILHVGLPEGLESPRGVVIDHAKSARWIYVLPPYTN